MHVFQRPFLLTSTLRVLRDMAPPVVHQCWTKIGQHGEKNFSLGSMLCHSLADFLGISPLVVCSIDKNMLDSKSANVLLSEVRIPCVSGLHGLQSVYEC